MFANIIIIAQISLKYTNDVLSSQLRYVLLANKRQVRSSSTYNPIIALFRNIASISRAGMGL